MVNIYLEVFSCFEISSLEFDLGEHHRRNCALQLADDNFLFLEFNLLGWINNLDCLVDNLPYFVRQRISSLIGCFGYLSDSLCLNPVSTYLLTLIWRLISLNYLS